VISLSSGRLTQKKPAGRVRVGHQRMHQSGGEDSTDSFGLKFSAGHGNHVRDSTKLGFRNGYTPIINIVNGLSLVVD
jgi:hypothetical protein